MADFFARTGAAGGDLAHGGEIEQACFMCRSFGEVDDQDSKLTVTEVRDLRLEIGGMQ